MAHKSSDLERRKFLKMTAMAAGGATMMGVSGRTVAAPQALDEPDSPIYLALNISRVLNNEESFRLMREVGPKVCITTASHPGFLGFQANVQTGAMSIAGRYGGARVDMDKELNPIGNYQYTMWKTWQDHDDFHSRQFKRVFELCTACLPTVVEGPWEPVYRVVKARIPQVRSMGEITKLAQDLQQGKDFVRFATPGRCVTLAPHTVKPGTEAAFEKGVVENLEALSDSTGFLGYMVLKQMGVCALGSLMLDPESMAQALMTLGANPPDNPRPAFATPDARPTPPDYLVHTEWDSPELAKLGFAKVLVNHRIRKIHDDGVMAHLIKGPYIKFFRPMMEEPGWRDHLR